jgi:hypothetical protein
MVIYDKMIDEVILPCECGCSILQATRFTDDPIDDQAVYIQYYYSAFSNESVGLFQKLVDRIKGAFFVLFGKRYMLYEIVLNGNDKTRFIDFVKGLEE